jgi:chitinase
MKIYSIHSLLLLAVPLPLAHAQGTVSTFEHSVGQAKYVLVGGDPTVGGITTIPVVVVPVMLAFEAKKMVGKPFLMDATPDPPGVLRSPVFSNFAFPSGGTTPVCRRHASHHLSQG